MPDLDPAPGPPSEDPSRLGPIPGLIAEQPATVARCLDAARAFGGDWMPDGAHGIVLVGSGSSRNALGMVEGAFARAARGPVQLREPLDFADLLPTGAFAGHAVLVLSQGGRSTTSVAAARAARQAGLPTLAVTAEAASPIARLGEPLLVIPVGPEPVGPKTKGFLGSVAALHGLAAALGAPEPPRFDRDALARAIDPAREAATAFAATMDGADVLFVAGHGRLHGLALEASLKVAEMSGLPSAAFSTEELLHGRLHGVTERGLVLLLTEGGPRKEEADRAAAAMAARGCRLIPVALDDPLWNPAQCAPPWDAFGLVVTFQWLAVALAARRGLRPESMRHGALSAGLAIKLRAEP